MIDIQLSNELIELAESNNSKLPKEYDTQSAKFDDYGNLKVVYRDKDGKVLGSTSINEKANGYKVENMAESWEEGIDTGTLLKTYRRRNMLCTIAFYAIVLLLASLFVATIYLIQVLGGS